MRPGKPLLAGRLGGDRRCSACPATRSPRWSAATVFLAPPIARMLGLPGDPPAPQPARLGAALAANGPREHYMRARVDAGADGWRCTPFARQDSSLLSVLAEANAPPRPRRPATRPGRPATRLSSSGFDKLQIVYGE